MTHFDAAHEVQVDVWAWATPAEGITLNELIAEMARLGNTVLEVDVENNRLKLLDTRGTDGPAG